MIVEFMMEVLMEVGSQRFKEYLFLGVDEIGGLHGWMNGVLLHFCPFSRFSRLRRVLFLFSLLSFAILVYKRWVYCLVLLGSQQRERYPQTIDFTVSLTHVVYE